jgi:hypothetical protein
MSRAANGFTECRSYEVVWWVDQCLGPFHACCMVTRAGAMSLDAPAKLGEADRGVFRWNIVPTSGNFPLPAPDPPNANRLQGQSLTSFNFRRFFPATVNPPVFALVTKEQCARLDAFPAATAEVIGRSGLMPRADTIVEASRRKGWRCAAEHGRGRAFRRAWPFGSRLLLQCWPGHLGCGFTRWARREFRGRLRRGRLDRHLIVGHRGLIIALRSEQIAYEATDAA